MMNKERLEEIKYKLYTLHNCSNTKEEIKDFIFNHLKIEWLIEQVECVQELETRIDKFYKLNMKLYKQNKRYREALKWYSENSPHGNVADEALEEWK